LLWGLVAVAVIGAPLVEEIVFRGLLQTALRHARIVLRRWGVIVVASAVFTGIHVGAADWHAMPALFVLSLGLGFLYERTGSLWAPILMHALFNASQIALTLLLTPA
ncbi:MAG: CPBP family glutamic-type intramembrane protease, partial [Phycisphaerae bacterium]|nr:CPBP family glutamic-type intramembrane protease [Phycisphaerae bacterium]